MIGFHIGRQAAYVWAAPVILGVMFLDLMLPLGVATGVFYVAAIMLAACTSDKRFIIGVSVVTSTLTLLGMLFSPEGGEFWKVVTNRGIAIVVIAGASFFLIARQKAGAALARELKVQRVLIRVGQAVSHSADLGEQIRNVSVMLNEIVDHDRLVVASLCQDGETLIDSYVAGEHVWGSTTAPVSIREDPVLEGLILHRIPVSRNGAESRQISLTSDSEEARLRIGLKSMIAVPLVCQSEVVGILNFRSKNENAYGPEELNLVLRVADLISGTVANTRTRWGAEEAHRKLEKSETDYRDLVESSHDLIWRCDAEGRFTYLNPAWERTHGFTIDEMLGRLFTDFQLPEIAKRDIEIFKSLAAGGSVFDHETSHVSKSGTEIFLLCNANPEVNADGEFIGTKGTARDVTDERNALTGLRVRAAVVEASGDALIVADRNGCISLVNAAAEGMFGRSRDELVGMQVTMLMPTQYRADHAAGLKRLNDTGEPILDTIVEMEGLRADGTHFPVELLVSSTIAAGDSVEYVAAIRDITDRKKAEEDLRIRVAALEATAEMVVITDDRGNIEYVNKAFTEGTGYDLEEAIGANPRILQSGRQDSEFYEDLWNTVTTGKVWRGTLVNRRKDGSEYPEEMTVTPVTGKDGEVLRFIAIKRDISERLRAVAEQETARDMETEYRNLVRLNDSRNEFLSLVSHELRTPLTSLLAFGDILSKNRGDTMTHRQLEQLNLMRNNGWKLNELIDDLLDVSRSEAGTFKIEKQDFELTEMLAEVTASATSIFERKRQNLSVHIQDGPVWIHGDQRRVAQVITNLLTNASKYSPDRGNIDVRTSDSDGGIEIVVADNGIGIAKANIAVLFNPFFRVDNEQTRKEGGTGLGLAIAKTIAELHGGAISVESTLGVGTTMRLVIPTIYPKPSANGVRVSGQDLTA